MTDFLTITEVGDYIGRDLSADDGAILAVSMACETVRSLTEQDFTPTVGGTAILDGTGTDCLLLPQTPVTAAGTVAIDGTALAATDYKVTSEGELFRTDGTATWADNGGYPASPVAYWPQGRRNISVTYDYGYAGSAPDDVRMVALAIATRLITQGGAVQETVGQVSKKYAAAATDLTNGERAILRRYKQPR